MFNIKSWCKKKVRDIFKVFRVVPKSTFGYEWRLIATEAVASVRRT